ncbi:MAG: thiol-disulfide oxidoreductase DCC family protein [Thermodesulfobacteriota bacterium]
MDRLNILFDGVCNLCNGFVVFIIKRDPDAKFKFASLQSDEGERLQEEFNMDPANITTMVLVDNNNYYVKSDAALRILKELNGIWHFLYYFIFVPRPVRDTVYDIVAKYRYRWFGRQDECMVPTPDLKKRFL